MLLYLEILTHSHMCLIKNTLVYQVDLCHMIVIKLLLGLLDMFKDIIIYVEIHISLHICIHTYVRIYIHMYDHFVPVCVSVRDSLRA